MSIQSFIESICVQDAILWRYNGTDEFGRVTYSAPEQIKVRWEDNDQVIVDDFGKSFESKAEILLPIDVNRLDYIALGTLDEESSSTVDDPTEVEGAHQIIRFTKVPMIKSTTVFVRKAFV